MGERRTLLAAGLALVAPLAAAPPGTLPPTDPAPPDPVPVIAPVAVGQAPVVGDAASVPGASTLDAALSPVVSGVDLDELLGSAPPAFAEPITIDVPGAVAVLPATAVDPCATIPAPPDCPSGYAVTIGGPGLPPEPFMFAGQGHEHARTATPSQPWTCPADSPVPGDGQSAVTVWSRTPLERLTLAWRIFGSADPWVELEVAPGTPAASTSGWLDRLEEEAWDSATFGLLPTCVVVTRDPHRAFALRLTATDVFGRSFEGNSEATLADASPSGRPPTQVVVDTEGMTVDAFTTAEGMVEVATRFIADPDDTVCEPPAGGADVVYREGERGRPPSPLGVWDPAYSSRVRVRRELPPGGLALVCATVYDTDNTLRPAGTDVFVVRASWRNRPVVTVESIDVVDPELSVVNFFVDEMRPGGGCSTGGFLVDSLSTGTTTLGHTLWECRDDALPADPDGVLALPLQMTATRAGRSETSLALIGIYADTCSRYRICVRPDEWYSVHLPGSRDDTVTLRISYPWVGESPTRLGQATVVSRTDRGSDPTTGPPVVLATWPPGLRFDRASLTYTEPATFLVDRPVTMQRVRLVSAEATPAAGCEAGRDVPVAAGPATEFTVQLTGLCPRQRYAVQVTVVDAGGASHTSELSPYGPHPSLFGTVRTQIALEGGPGVPNWGLLYSLSVRLDGDSGTGRSWILPSGAEWVDRACIPLSGATIGSSRDAFVELDGATLEVSVLIDVSTTGEDGCTSGSDGFPPVELRGSVTLAQLAAGTVTLRTGADAPFQASITITPVDPGWGPVA